jgi:hypothetical protein
MSDTPLDWDKYKYGLGGREELDVRDRITPILRRHLDKKGIDGWKSVWTGAGARIILVTLIGHRANEHFAEIKTIIKENIPANYSYELNYREK